jgi:hypothetical protein
MPSESCAGFASAEDAQKQKTNQREEDDGMKSAETVRAASVATDRHNRKRKKAEDGTDPLSVAPKDRMKRARQCYRPRAIRCKREALNDPMGGHVPVFSDNGCRGEFVGRP